MGADDFKMFAFTMNDHHRSEDALPSDASGVNSSGSDADLTARSPQPSDTEPLPLEQWLAELPTKTDIDFPQAFQQTLEALAVLESRYLQIQRDRQLQAAVQQKLATRSQEPKTSAPINAPTSTTPEPQVIAQTETDHHDPQFDRQFDQQFDQHTDGQTGGQADVQADLARLRSWLEILDFNLESTLFRWSSLRDPFWFGLRFGSLGFTIGWLLHACTAS